MSLRLRTTSQPILDDNGLANFHVRVDDCSKCLVITSECGKPLCTINGIRFGRVDPATAEIEAACDLLDAFIATHKETLLNVINTSKAVHNLPDEFDTGIEGLVASTWYGPTKVAVGGKLSAKSNSQSAAFNYKVAGKSESNIRIVVSTHTEPSVEITSGRYSQQAAVTVPDVLKVFDLIPQMRKLLKPFGKFVAERKAAIDARDKAETEVNKCDI